MQRPEADAEFGASASEDESTAPAKRRQKIVRQRKDGRLVRVKQPDRADNARPRVVRLVHAGGSRASLLKARFRANSPEALLLTQTAATLAHQLGGDLTPAQLRVIEHAARLRLLAEIAWHEINRSGALKSGQLNGAANAFLRAVREERHTLLLLGLERRTKPLPDLKDYLEEIASDGDSGEAK